MDERFHIRGARTEDIAEIERLLVSGNTEYEKELPEKVWKEWVKSMMDSLHSGKGELIVGECEAKVVAFIQFFPDSSQSEIEHWPEGSASMRMMVVSPSHRGHGYGTRLLQECIRRAKNLKRSTLFLQTGRPMVAAQRIFKKLGFRPDSRFNEMIFGEDDHSIAYRYDF